MQRTRLAASAALLALGLAGCMAESTQAPRARSPRMAASGAPPNTVYHCASPEPGQPPDCGWREETSAEQTVCNEETVTGSNITRTVCRSQDEAFRDEALSKEWKNTWPPNPARVESMHVGADPFGRVYPQ